MVKFAFIKDGVVVNTIISTQEFVDKAYKRDVVVQCEDWVGIGHLYDGTTFTVPPYDPAPALEAIKKEARAFLRQCDWTQLDDAKFKVGISKQDWNDYRDALRDTMADPANVPMPDPPSDLDEG